MIANLAVGLASSTGSVSVCVCELWEGGEMEGRGGEYDERDNRDKCVQLGI